MAQGVKHLAVLGCTGSVGSSVLDVCRCYRDRFEVKVLAAASGRGENIARLWSEFSVTGSQPQIVLASVRDDLPDGMDVRTGERALIEAVTRDDIDHIVIASSGVAAVKALDCALKLGKEVSLANKESALLFGEALAPFCRSGQLRPLDSEHNAIWQCMHGESYEAVNKLFLTASGGPFLRHPLNDFESITPEVAAVHPVWSMGRKISVDSATMINKGIEVLEAHCLFGIPGDRIIPVIHPGSRVHGMVSFRDSSVKMLLSCPDMRLAALSALSWPERPELRLDRIHMPDVTDLDLHFERPEQARYPGLYTALDVVRMGEPYPVILIAADEIAVEAFLEERILFTDIARIVASVIDSYNGAKITNLDERIDLYQRCQAYTYRIIADGVYKNERRTWN